MYGGKFAFQNRLGYLIAGRNLPFLLSLNLYFRAISKYKPPPPKGDYIWRGNVAEGFLCYEFVGLIFGGANRMRGAFSEFYGIFFFAPYFDILTGRLLF